MTGPSPWFDHALHGTVFARDCRFVKRQFAAEAAGLLAEAGVMMEALPYPDPVEERLTPLRNAEGPRFPPFMLPLLSTGRIACRCPFCNVPCSTDQSFPVCTTEYTPVVFYRFECCRSFYLMLAAGWRVGLYLPSVDLIVSLVDYVGRNLPSDETYYGEAAFKQWVGDFLSLMRRNLPKVEAYVRCPEPRKLTLAIGFVNNLGHYAYDELASVQELVDHNLCQGIEGVLAGPHDLLSVSDLFPELPAARRSEWGPALFHQTLDGNLTLVRPYHRGPFQDSLAHRCIVRARSRCSPSFLDTVDRSRMRRPLIWVTLRGHTRVWVSEVQGLARIVTALASDHPNLGVVVDGVPREKQRLKHLRALCGPDVDLFDALDLSLDETLTWVNAADFFIAPFANGTFFTTVANLPGIVHSHAEWLEAGKPLCINRRENCALAIPVLGAVISTGTDVFSHDYEVDWHEILNHARDLIGRR